MLTTYICGFLNSGGGTIYLGITDKGIIKGITLNRKLRDELSLNLDNKIRKFDPPVMPDLCQLYFCKVFLI